MTSIRRWRSPCCLNWQMKSIPQSLPELARQLKKLGEVLGLLQLNPEKFIKGAVEGVDAAWVEEMIQKRKDAKRTKISVLQMLSVRN